jgi:EAL domain-containing protein (putative c-di-GMP-specific phosphodiesterase class I)
VTPSGDLYATEALGRGTSSDLPEGPWPLFQLAESGDLEIALSRLFREVASNEAYQQAPGTTLFLNSHPSELNDIDALLESMSGLTHTKNGLRTVLEVHEDGVSDLGKLRDLQVGLKQMNIGLAYDDFGAGQSRLRELTEVPPDYLKFDMGLIRDIDTAPQVKRNLLAVLAETANASGTTTLAEGVASAGELACCIDMGMSLIQGFYFARPDPRIPTSG